MTSVESGARGTAAATAAEGEVELKLRASPQALEAIAGSHLLGSGAGGAGTTRQLESTYFDTADQRLRRRGVTLRVRKTGNRYVQTVKTEGRAAAGLARRGEWEVPLDGPEPDPAAVADESARERLGLLLPGDLQPLFSTRVERHTRVLNGADLAGEPSVIELALDRGEIVGRQGRDEIAELELELLKGPPAALYRLARALHEVAPLAVETRSKAERGYALATGEPPAWRKAARLALDPAATVEEALEQILRGCLGHWTANQAAALDGSDPEGVHQMRVGLRRFRSALSLFAKVVPPPQLDWLKTESKWVLSGLGPARDWDVFLEELLAPVLDARPGDQDLPALGALARERRATSYETARGMIASQRYNRFLLDLGAWLEGRDWREAADAEIRTALGRPVLELADRLLDKRHRKVRKLGRGFARQSSEQRHRLRIAIKKLRYSCEFFHSLYKNGKAQDYIVALSRMQDGLGHLNDVAVAERLLDELHVEGAAHAKPVQPASKHDLWRAAGIVVGWYAHGVAVAEPKLRKDWKAFKARPAFWHRPAA